MYGSSSVSTGKLTLMQVSWNLEVDACFNVCGSFKIMMYSHSELHLAYVSIRNFER